MLGFNQKRAFQMSFRIFASAVLFAAASLMGGCASDGDFLGGALTTSSIEPAAKAQSNIDPQCVALMSKIDALRKEGTPERIEKVSTGKTATAVVKRQALQRMTELDKTNAEFQSRCSTLSRGQRSVAAPGGTAKVAASNAAK